MLIELALALAGLAVLAGLIYGLERQGRRAAENEQRKQVLDDIHTAERIRGRLNADAGFAKRVRDRFTR